MKRKGPTQTIVEILRGLALSAFAVLPLTAEEGRDVQSLSPAPREAQVDEAQEGQAGATLRHYLTSLRLRDYHV